MKIAEIFPHIFRKKFVKAMVLLKKLLNSWFDEIFWFQLSFEKYFVKSFNSVKNSWNQRFSEYYISYTTLISRNFCVFKLSYNFKMVGIWKIWVCPVRGKPFSVHTTPFTDEEGLIRTPCRLFSIQTTLIRLISVGSMRNAFGNAIINHSFLPYKNECWATQNVS